MFAWSLTAILLFWVCFLLYMIFAGLFGCHKKNKIEEIDLTNSRGKYEWDGKEYDTLEEQSAAKVKYFLQLAEEREKERKALINSSLKFEIKAKQFYAASQRVL